MCHRSVMTVNSVGWYLTICPFSCAALPLVNSPGTSITCTTASDRDARIAATGAARRRRDENDENDENCDCEHGDTGTRGHGGRGQISKLDTDGLSLMMVRRGSESGLRRTRRGVGCPAIGTVLCEEWHFERHSRFARGTGVLRVLKLELELESGAELRPQSRRGHGGSASVTVELLRT